MLKIWYYANIEYMKDAPSYFDNVYEEKPFRDPNWQLVRIKGR